jgi:serine/threonine protein kinase
VISDRLPTSLNGHAANAQDAEAGRVFDSYLAALEAGRLPDPEGLLAAHPHLADQLRACLEVMRWADRLAEGQMTGPGFVLGDFRIVREIGRGGMGIVYEAEQLSLGRRVALKILPASAAIDPKQFRRFQVESHATACLHHTHIVPVFTTGHEQGVYYFAMQYIEGQGLDAVIRSLRQLEGLEEIESTAPEDGKDSRVEFPRGRGFFETVARLGIQAAEALDYTHALGIIHRNIKPANLLVDVHGDLWVTDFGLARVQADRGLTTTGDVLGTMRYMSPEQVVGDRGLIDHRCDIYSLGATLYELLTLCPAHDGRDRARLVRRIGLEEPKPPRLLNPAIPRDLETIVLKAMAREVPQRYASARDLADDLRRFLDHRPIRARRPSLWMWTRKMVRRHRTAVMSVASALLIMGLAFGIAVAQWKRNQQFERSERSRRYVEDVRLAAHFTQIDQLTQATELLARQVPRPGEEDLRSFPWFHL